MHPDLPLGTLLEPAHPPHRRRAPPLPTEGVSCPHSALLHVRLRVNLSRCCVVSEGVGSPHLMVRFRTAGLQGLPLLVAAWCRQGSGVGGSESDWPTQAGPAEGAPCPLPVRKTEAADCSGEVGCL